jgi:hypothetical protein
VKATHGAAALIAAKRQKTVPHPSLLLEAQPEILWKIYFFLSLKEALLLCQTHRHHFNELSNDLYQYSFIMNEDTMKEQGLVRNTVDKYMFNQSRGLCNLADNDYLRAVLRNETLPYVVAENFIFHLIYHYKTDNGQAASILIEDGRCHVEAYQLERSLEKDYCRGSGSAARRTRQARLAFKCVACSDNIGCYYCANCDECDIRHDDVRFCRECIEDNHFCKVCKDYVCPSCYAAEVLECCDQCGRMECHYHECKARVMNECAICDKKNCISCIANDGEHWVAAITDEDEDHVNEACLSCSQNAVAVAIEVANRRWYE